MKIGKHIELGEYENIKLSYGTIDNKKLKSIYIDMTCWLDPTANKDFDKIINTAKRNIKQRIKSENNEFFKKESIVDFDIKTNSIKDGKRSFMNLQITLFTEKVFDVKSTDIKIYISNLLKDIINNDLIDKNLFIFNRTKE